MTRLALALALASLPLVAHADKAPPPTRKVALAKVETGPCERDGKAIDCPKEAIAAGEEMLALVTKQLRREPIRCGYGPDLARELHMYWGDGFGSVVNIDFDQTEAPFPECAWRLVQHVADALTAAFKPTGDKDDMLRVHWTVGFTLAR
ncbi:MAG: hypothetical protein IT385_12275 [Deltaproteobacteria bacterium]|nr:hypothetical protein [Deltaproteobacteria bacterium]